MSIIRIGVRLAALCAGLAMAGTAWAAGTYPDHKIRMIVPFAAGGPTDVIGAPGGGAAVRRAGPAGLCGEFARRRRQSRRRDRQARRAGRLHHRRRLDRLHHQSEHVHDHRLRSAQGFRADLAGGGVAQRDHRASFGGGEKPQRADRPDQGQSGQNELRPAIDRLDPASRRRADEAGLRARHGDGAVQRRAARHQFHLGQPHADGVHGAAAGDRRHQGRQPARHRHPVASSASRRCRICRPTSSKACRASKATP